MSVTILPGVFTIPEAAEKAKVSANTIRRQIKAGKLRARRIGSCVRILEPELARWLEDYGD
jgi:excisionase family DNA binding protein